MKNLVFRSSLRWKIHTTNSQGPPHFYISRENVLFEFGRVKVLIDTRQKLRSFVYQLVAVFREFVQVTFGRHPHPRTKRNSELRANLPRTNFAPRGTTSPGDHTKDRQMIPDQQMIPKMAGKWSPTGKWSPKWTANDSKVNCNGEDMKEIGTKTSQGIFMI